MQDCEENTQNTTLVELKTGGVGAALPRGFPYFCVGFGNCPGYAHVIEDEQSFPEYFGLVSYLIIMTFCHYEKEKVYLKKIYLLKNLYL